MVLWLFYMYCVNHPKKTMWNFYKLDLSIPPSPLSFPSPSPLLLPLILSPLLPLTLSPLLPLTLSHLLPLTLSYPSPSPLSFPSPSLFFPSPSPPMSGDCGTWRTDLRDPLQRHPWQQGRLTHAHCHSWAWSRGREGVLREHSEGGQQLSPPWGSQYWDRGHDRRLCHIQRDPEDHPTGQGERVTEW